MTRLRAEKADSEVRENDFKRENMVLENISRLHGIFLRCGKVVTDSREIEGGELFFALKGERFDGNAFAVSALERGAACAVVSDPALAGERYVHVDDTLKALQELARYHRASLAVSGSRPGPLPVIALTGTNGKTTTKELIRAVLSARYRVLATEGNLNNHIGVPLTLLRLTSRHDMAVIEMGASAPGEIASLARIALPNYGLITNVGKAHLAGFGSFEGVKRTKGELYDYLQRTADKAFVNMDNPCLREMASERPDLSLIPYGMEYSGASVLEADASWPYLSVRLSGGRVVRTHLIGAYNADNVMAAIAVGAFFGISEEEAAGAVEAYVPSNSRSQLEKRGSNTYILDTYNANPTSMSAALDNLASMQADKKAVMLGDMLELGDDSQPEHGAVLLKVAFFAPQYAYFVGEEFAAALAGGGAEALDEAGVRHAAFPDSSQLASYLRSHPLDDTLILVKGSRGMKMEKVL